MKVKIKVSVDFVDKWNGDHYMVTLLSGNSYSLFSPIDIPAELLKLSEGRYTYDNGEVFEISEVEVDDIITYFEDSILVRRGGELWKYDVQYEQGEGVVF